jgi:hypothetical protein
MENQIEIFKANDNQTVVQVRFDNDTVWLSQKQMSELFGKDSDTIGLHLKNIYLDAELEESSTTEHFSVVQKEGKRTVKRNIKCYNLDAIISVGYRVNSKRGIQFRQWATQRLKEYLVDGVAINEKRLEQKNKEIKILHDGIRILSRAIEDHAVNYDNYTWLHKFSLGLKLLDDYDHEALDVRGNNTTNAAYPAMAEYVELVNQMRIEFNSDVFGIEKDGGFDSAVNLIKQGFADRDVYPSIEEKAAMLLYLVVKNHAFVDGNKRIAAACFLLFMERNGILFKPNGETIISNEALASLTLFVAASKADEMETVKNLLISILNRNLK